MFIQKSIKPFLFCFILVSIKEKSQFWYLGSFCFSYLFPSLISRGKTLRMVEGQSWETGYRKEWFFCVESCSFSTEVEK